MDGALIGVIGFALACLVFSVGLFCWWIASTIRRFSDTVSKAAETMEKSMATLGPFLLSGKLEDIGKMAQVFSTFVPQIANRLGVLQATVSQFYQVAVNNSAALAGGKEPKDAKDETSGFYPYDEAAAAVVAAAQEKSRLDKSGDVESQEGEE